jgi:hypothetical protein
MSEQVRGADCSEEYVTSATGYACQLQRIILSDNCAGWLRLKTNDIGHSSNYPHMVIQAATRFYGGRMAMEQRGYSGYFALGQDAAAHLSAASHVTAVPGHVSSYSYQRLIAVSVP